MGYGVCQNRVCRSGGVSLVMAGVGCHSEASGGGVRGMVMDVGCPAQTHGHTGKPLNGECQQHQ